MKERYKAIGWFILTALAVFLLVLLTIKKATGYPAHFDAPWWKFLVAGGLAAYWGNNTLSRWRGK